MDRTILASFWFARMPETLRRARAIDLVGGHGRPASWLVLSLRALQYMPMYQLARQFKAYYEGQVIERVRVSRELPDTLPQSFQGLIPVLQAMPDLLLARAVTVLPYTSILGV